MRWTSFYKTPIIILILKCCACSGGDVLDRKELPAYTAGKDTAHRIRYDVAIRSIDQTTPDIETWDALFYSKQFVGLYEHSAWYIAEASDVLSKKSFTERQKMICLCSLQHLSIDQYIPVLRQCDSLFNAGQISENLLSWSIAPDFSKRHLVVRNYKNEQVKFVLNNLLQNSRTSSNFRDMIKTILSGALWDNIKMEEGDT